MDCPEPPTNPPDPTPSVPWPFSPLRRSYLWDWESYGVVHCGECDRPADEDERCDDCGSCSHCVGGEMVYNEKRDEYLCEKCTEMKESD